MLEVILFFALLLVAAVIAISAVSWGFLGAVWSAVWIYSLFTAEPPSRPEARHI